VNSAVEMMPSVGMPEPSPITGLVMVRSSTAKVTSVQVSSPSSKDRVDYSESYLDWDNVRAAANSSKFSHLTEKEMPITTLEMELPLWETAIAEGIPSIPLIPFLFQSCKYCFDTCLVDICRGYRYC